MLAAQDLSHPIHYFFFFIFLLDTSFFEFIFGIETEALLENRQSGNCPSIGENPALEGKLGFECGIPEP